jgi:hypothetical protein
MSTKKAYPFFILFTHLGNQINCLKLTKLIEICLVLVQGSLPGVFFVTFCSAAGPELKHLSGYFLVEDQDHTIFYMEINLWNSVVKALNGFQL